MITLLLGGAFAMLDGEARGIRSMARSTNAETRTQDLLRRIESELAHAQGSHPRAWLTADLLSGDTGLAFLDSSAAFPDRGSMLIGRGSPAEEEIAYNSLLSLQTGVQGLQRGMSCTSSGTHLEGEQVLWSGSADPLDNQLNPSPTEWDGRFTDALGTVFFRGNGSGFVFRVPTDPAGGTNWLANGKIVWGATVGGIPTADGWCSIYFSAQDTLIEATSNTDVNGDGDLLDRFDLGKLHLRTWNSLNPAALPTDVGLCPSFILQEECAWGSDLDGDGFEDPLFLFDESSGLLRIRLSICTQDDRGRLSVDRVNTTLFLRNSVAR